MKKARATKRKILSVSLRSVSQRARTDPAFLNALLKNADRALEAAGWKLSAADSRQLKERIKCTHKLKRMEGAYLKPLRDIGGRWPPIYTSG